MVQTKNDETTKLKERIRQILLSQSQATITVLSSLLAVQDDLGYTPMAAIEEVATYCDVTINDVWGIAEYYTNFQFSKSNKHTVQVCWGPACHIKGAQLVLKAITDEFKVSEETLKGKFDLKYNTCLGACAHAPVISFGHDLVGQMNPEKAIEAIKNKISDNEADRNK